MTLVGKPMTKSKWVGVKLISFITEKWVLHLFANLFFCLLCLCLNVNFVLHIGPSFFIHHYLFHYLHACGIPSIMHIKYINLLSCFFFMLLLANQSNYTIASKSMRFDFKYEHKYICSNHLNKFSVRVSNSTSK